MTVHKVVVGAVPDVDKTDGNLGMLGIACSLVMNI